MWRFHTRCDKNPYPTWTYVTMNHQSIFSSSFLGGCYNLASVVGFKPTIFRFRGGCYVRLASPTWIWGDSGFRSLYLKFTASNVPITLQSPLLRHQQGAALHLVTFCTAFGRSFEDWIPIFETSHIILRNCLDLIFLCWGINYTPVSEQCKQLFTLYRK